MKLKRFLLAIAGIIAASCLVFYFLYFLLLKSSGSAIGFIGKPTLPKLRITKRKNTMM